MVTAILKLSGSGIVAMCDVSEFQSNFVCGTKENLKQSLLVVMVLQESGW